MARFTRKINMAPNEVKHMTLGQKKECMSEINSRRDLAWKYSVYFFFGSFVYIALYTLLSLGYMLRMNKMPENLSVIFFIVPFFVMVPSFLAHSMDIRLVIWAALAYMLSCVGLAATLSLVNAWLAPFAAAGAVLYIRMISVCDTFAELSKAEGFPDFEDIEAMKDEAMLKLNSKPPKKEDNGLNSLTETAILIAKAEQEKKAAEENARKDAQTAEPPKAEEKHLEIISETAKTEEKPAETKPEKPKSEEKPSEAKPEKPKPEEKPAETKPEKPKSENKQQQNNKNKQTQGNKNGGGNKKSGGKKKHKKK